MPPRPNRIESQRQTRERLLDAAFEIIAESGIAAASTRGICERAGYSQGAFYSNFADRDALLLQVLDRHVKALLAELDVILSRAEGQGLAAFSGWFGRLGGQRRLSLLSIELRLHALRTPAFAARLAPAEAEWSAGIARLLERYGAASGSPLRLPADAGATVLRALWTGLVLGGQEGACDAAQLLEEVTGLLFAAPDGSGAPAKCATG